jgi:2-hydroxychromene-2-carboxylate isomerase
MPLRQRRKPPASLDSGRADLFGFDLASVETYFVVGPVLNCASSTIEWYPVPAAQLTDPSRLDGLDADREAAERRASELGMTLCWPKNHPDPVPRAMRAASQAAREGFGGPFVAACARLAFAGGFDLDGENPNAIEAAARVAGRDSAAILAAADEHDRQQGKLDSVLLASLGIARLPALRLDGVLACGERAVSDLLRARAA